MKRTVPICPPHLLVELISTKISYATNTEQITSSQYFIVHLTFMMKEDREAKNVPWRKSYVVFDEDES